MDSTNKVSGANRAGKVLVFFWNVVCTDCLVFVCVVAFCSEISFQTVSDFGVLFFIFSESLENQSAFKHL